MIKSRIKHIYPKQFVSIVILSFLFICNTNIKGQPESELYRVLFIGNSYTYFNSMPQMFKAVVENQYPKVLIEVKFIGGPGETLKDHWEDEKTLKEIKSGYWNYVVLQEQSMLGSNNLANPDSPRQFYEYARKLDTEIKKSGAQTIFFMTWSRKNLPQQQKYLTKAYQTISKELGSITAPVGLVWKKFRKISTIDLYLKHGSHPTINGSYLCALTLYCSIFKSIPENLPGNLYGYGRMHNGKLYSERTSLSNLSVDNLKLLKQAVEDVIFKGMKK